MIQNYFDCEKKISRSSISQSAEGGQRGWESDGVFLHQQKGKKKKICFLIKKISQTRVLKNIN